MRLKSLQILREIIWQRRYLELVRFYDLTSILLGCLRLLHLLRRNIHEELTQVRSTWPNAHDLLAFPADVKVWIDSRLLLEVSEDGWFANRLDALRLRIWLSEICGLLSVTLVSDVLVSQKGRSFTRPCSFDHCARIKLLGLDVCEVIQDAVRFVSYILRLWVECWHFVLRLLLVKYGWWRCLLSWAIRLRYRYDHVLSTSIAQGILVADDTLVVALLALILI